MATFYPSADTYTSSAQSTTNYGTLTFLRCDNNAVFKTFLKFTVTGLSGAPSAASVNLFALDGHTAGVTAYACANTSWTETGLNYSNEPTIGSSDGSSGSISAFQWMSVDVSNIITGNGTFTIVLQADSAESLRLLSKEAAGYSPYLDVTPGTGGATLTPSALAVTPGLPAPTVVPGTVTIAPAALASGATLPAASVDTVVTLSPAALANSATLPAPTLDTPVTITPAALPAPVTIPDPTVDAPSNVVLEPAALAVAPVLPAPTIDTTVTITPAGLAVVPVLPAPTLDTPVSLSPAALASPATIPTHTIVAPTPALLLEPAALAVVPALPAATVVPGLVTIEADPIAELAQLPAATVVPGGVTIAAAVLPLAFTLPDPGLYQPTVSAALSPTLAPIMHDLTTSARSTLRRSAKPTRRSR